MSPSTVAEAVAAKTTEEKYRDYVITSFVKAIQPVVIERGEGAMLYDANGRAYLDCFAGISVVNAGYSNSDINTAAKAQIDKIVHSGAYVYYSQPVADLAEKMAEITPRRLRKTFFANSGAEAIEGALKLARLYTGRREVIALEMSFHGRTYMTLSVTGNSGRKKRGGPYASGVAFAPAPYTYRSQWDDDERCGEECAKAVERVIRYHTSGDVAAFLAEPIMGEGGIIVPPKNYFRRVKEVLDRYGILFIADEVQSGFGRTGAMFAIEHYGVEPDILATAKGIADGFPLGGFTTRPEIADCFQPGDHLSTFGGNPVSCAAALANIEYLQKHQLPQQTAEKGEYVIGRLGQMRQRMPIIGDVRGLGLMVGIELVEDAKKTPALVKAESVRAICMREGVLVGVGGVYGNVVRLQPPLVITREQLDQALTVLEKALREVSA
jgi:4-aminobutyrate aminotransferase / (S)-3-amino-2-methylpropionate transaminase / 5-aminovalerate transaminase